MKSACSVDGCSRPAKSRTWCGTHYARWRTTGSVDLAVRVKPTCTAVDCGWANGPMLALDFESTGVDAHTCRAVQVALCRILPAEAPVQHLWLLNPGCEIPEGAAAIHGISTERARAEGKPPIEVLTQVRNVITDWLRQGHPLVAFNATYDCTLLEAELERHGLPTITSRLGAFAPVIDPLVLHTRTSRVVSRKLGYLCGHYGLRHDGQHDAGHDALAAARVAWRIGQVNPRLGALTAMELHELQVQWRREQCDAKRAEYDGLGWKHDGWDPSWPVRRAPSAVPA